MPPPIVRGARRLPTSEHGERDDSGIVDVAWGILRRQWHIVLQAVIVTAVLAAAVSATRPKQYDASASILFGTAAENVLGSPSFVDRNRQAATNESLLKLPVVADAASEELGGRIPASEIGGSISVVSEPDADVALVVATTGDPQRSADIANAYSQAFIAFRRTSARQQIQDAIDLARRGAADLTLEQQEGAEGEALQDRIQQLETAKALQDGGAELVQPAVAPTSPSSPKPVRDGILGALLGGILGFGIGALRERRHGAFDSVEDLEDFATWPVIARVPRSRALAQGHELSPRGEEAESFRLLRASLRYLGAGEPIDSLMITSSRPGEGKSVTARRLAETMAAMGDRVVLVDADMHRGMQGDVFDELEPGGLSDVLVGADLDASIVHVPVGPPDEKRTLAILRTGAMPPNPSELLESQRMRDVLEQLRADYEIVIVDTPPLPVLSDALALVAQVSGVVAVAAIGMANRDDLRDLDQQIGLFGGSVLGVVANFAPSSSRFKGYYA